MKEIFEATVLNAINKIRKKFHNEIEVVGNKKFQKFEGVHLLSTVLCFPRLGADSHSVGSHLTKPTIR